MTKANKTISLDTDLIEFLKEQGDASLIISKLLREYKASIMAKEQFLSEKEIADKIRAIEELKTLEEQFLQVVGVELKEFIVFLKDAKLENANYTFNDLQIYNYMDEIQISRRDENYIDIKKHIEKTFNFLVVNKMIPYYQKANKKPKKISPENDKLLLSD